MKLFKDFESAELARLSPDEIQELIQLECANRGVLLIEKPKYQPSLTALMDDSYFEIEGTGLKSKDEALIRVVAEAIRDSAYAFQDTDYDWNVGYDFQYLKNDYTEKTFEVKKVLCFKESTVREKSKLLKYVEEKKEYDRKLSEYYSHKEKFEKVRDEIQDAYLVARSRLTRAKELQNLFEVYKRLAGGDLEVAERFFENSYPGEIHLVKGEENHGRTEANVG